MLPLLVPAADPLDSSQLVREPDGRLSGHRGGLVYRSHFQPIYSLSHGRVVGHEALLRASDARGGFVAPPQVFAVGDDFDELLARDRFARWVHAANYTQAAGDAEQWLFLNVHPEVFARWPLSAADGVMQRMAEQYRLPAHRVVIEVLEDSVRQDADFDAAVRMARERGFLVALDDFGAGHSNFDRVWRIRPEIVKLDRSLVARAAADRSVRRVVAQMVSLLHECGALVLMEGVETVEEAHVALESDADLVQGYLFGRPQPGLAPPRFMPPALDQAWAGFDERWRGERRGYRERIGPYFNAIGYGSALLAGGRGLGEACASFLALPGAEVAYLLGADGLQVDLNRWARPAGDRPQPFAPLRDASGARWSRRPYFRRAVESPGKVQVTRPYRTLHGGHLCVTVSAAFPQPGAHDPQALMVLCGDVRWDPHAE